ncbi:hypothetical protein UPYG_G00121730 [Umbra pygmaea]|uniref:Uncharacterized protein n=1 Tax=Umbra pygmaea TaxID=75934 RepID=A0ABD0X548_UMBPY
MSPFVAAPGLVVSNNDVTCSVFPSLSSLSAGWVAVLFRCWAFLHRGPSGSTRVKMHQHVGASTPALHGLEPSASSNRSRKASDDESKKRTASIAHILVSPSVNTEHKDTASTHSFSSNLHLDTT